LAKRKVALTSSHNERDGQDGPLAACSTEGSPAETLYRNKIPAPFRYIPKEGEQLIEEEVYIPDVD